MQEVFNKYKELFQKRYELVSSLDMGEDSVRYDFFQALQEKMGLNPWDIQLEYPLGVDAFIAQLARPEGAKRGEKPVMDLVVNTSEIKLCAEFGFFRRNSNDNGRIDTTGKTFKMLNDFIRLAIFGHLNNSKSFFVCVADEWIIDHQIRGGMLPPFPAQQYRFHYDGLIEIMGTSKEAKKALPDKFLHRFRELELNINANLVMREEIVSELNPQETYILVWEVESYL